MKIRTLVALFGVLSALTNMSLANAQATPTDFSDAAFSISGLRINYNEHEQTFGTAPTSLSEIGELESSYDNELVDHVGISPTSGAIMVGLSDRFGDKNWIAFISKQDQFGNFSWICQTTVSQEISASASCKGGLTYEGVDVVLDRDIFINTLLQTAVTKVVYAEYLQSFGTVPRSMKQLEVDAAFLERGRFTHVMVEPNSKAIMFGLSPIFGSNQWLTLIPRFDSSGYNIIGWSCRTTVPWSLAWGTGCWGQLPVERMLP